MKIVHVIHAFPPDSRAGSENYAEALALEQMQRHDVTVFHRTSDPERPEYEVTEGEVDGLPVVKINRTFRDLESFEGTYRNDSIATAFGEFLDRYRPDVVHFHHVTCLSTTCVGEAKQRGITVVYTLHDFWLLCPRGQLLRRDLAVCKTHDATDCVGCMAYQLRIKGGHQRTKQILQKASKLANFRLPKKLLRQLASRPFADESDATAEIDERTGQVQEMLQQVDLFVAPSRFLLERYVEFGVPADRIIYSDYGFDKSGFERFRSEGDGAGTSRADRRDGQPLRAVYLGTWIPSKGVHILVEAFRELDPTRAVLDLNGYAVPFDYDGEDDYERQLRDLADGAEHIRFRGPYEPKRIPELLADADVLVVPSIWYENSPLTIHEAFMAGAPVVTSAHGGMAGLVRDGLNGLTFTPGSPKALRAALQRLLDEPGLLDKLKASRTPVKPVGADARDLEERYAALAAS